MKNNEEVNLTNQWWQYSIDKIAQHLKTNITEGLKEFEVIQRLTKFGLNQLPEQKRISSFKLFINQFSSFIVWILIGALIISGFLGEWIDAVSIGVIIFLNALIGFIQEYSAERSLEALQKLIKPTSRVIREGKLQIIPSSNIVPGDLVALEAGDRVPADGRIVHTVQLSTQEAALTGESMPVSKVATILPDKELSIADKKNMAFMGTIIVSGKGRMVITETAQETELGKIASMLQVEEKEKTPLQIQIEQLGYRLVGMCLGIIAIILALSFLRGSNIITMILIALSLAVAAIPEGLPAVMTIALALGVQKMAKRNVLVRRLPSVETLGRTSVICTDKTGTLTQNEMTVRNIWINETFIDVTGVGYNPEGTFTSNGTKFNPTNIAELILILKIGTLCNNANIYEKDKQWFVAGNPTEGALLTAAGKAEFTKKDLELESPLLQEFPFDSERKRMSMLRDTPTGRRLFVKGATDILLHYSDMMLINGKQIQLTEEYKKKIFNANKQLASQALRVLAFAYRDINPQEPINESLEQNLVFVGLIAMMDPPRPEVKKAIQTCKKAGIQTVMITGDNKETAIAIAKELELLDKDSIAIDGTELNNMSDESLNNNVRQIAIYARASAAHKMRIIKAWKSQGEIVAMTGDGVNDAPAIKAADIGIAMGIIGTEVAKEASDMVIMDDNFASIVNAVEEGRGIYDNIIKFINYLLSSNIAELLVIFIGTLFGFVDPEGNPFVSLLPIHLLWLNLVTDGLPAIALALDPFDPHIMERPPKKPSESILSFFLAIRLFIIGIILSIGAIAACHFGLRTSASLAHTMALTMLVVLELVRIQIIRSQYHLGFLSNYWLIIALISSLGLQLLIIYIPVFQRIFKTVSLGIIEWGVIIAIAFFIWVTSILIQYISKETEKA